MLLSHKADSQAARPLVLLAVLTAALTLAPISARAQFAAAHTKGDFGVQSGSQPAPGFYFAPLYLRYSADTLRDGHGDPIRVDPEGRGSVVAHGFAPGFWWVSQLQLFGANYSVMVYPSLTNNALEVPILDLDSRADTGFGDLFVQPLNLGWHTGRADFLAGLGLYAPTGRYDADGSDNLGLGMWTFEPFAGTTLFLDDEKSWSLATTAFFELHTKKRGSDIKVGHALTLEGGLGKSFKGGSLNVGAAYYAQWKLSEDDLGRGVDVPEGWRLGKNRIFGLGPDVTIPIATKSNLIAFLNIRYFWEFGARSTLEGQNLVVTATFPIPSVSLR